MLKECITFKGIVKDSNLKHGYKKEAVLIEISLYSLVQKEFEVPPRDWSSDQNLNKGDT
jgi:hypothetical protein